MLVFSYTPTVHRIECSSYLVFLGLLIKREYEQSLFISDLHSEIETNSKANRLQIEFR